MRVKICGITNVEDALICQKLGADALGFVFHEESPRYLHPNDAREITSRLAPFITTVGVFVNKTAKEINQISWQAKLHMAQLHGDESPAMVLQIDRPVIKAFRVGEKFDYDVIDKYRGCNILLDTYSEDTYGGTGKRFDWSKIPDGYRQRMILSGGISVDHIAEIFTTICPAAVDISSSLEVYPGKKDPLAVQQFFHRIESLRRQNADPDGAGRAAQ